MNFQGLERLQEQKNAFAVRTGVESYVSGLHDRDAARLLHVLHVARNPLADSASRAIYSLKKGLENYIAGGGSEKAEREPVNDAEREGARLFAELCFYSGVGQNHKPKAQKE